MEWKINIDGNIDSVANWGDYIFVTCKETGNIAILFDHNGIRQISTIYGLERPNGIKINGNKIYITERYKSRVIILDIENIINSKRKIKYSDVSYTAINNLGDPYGIDVVDNKVYVTDDLNKRVIIITLDKRYLEVERTFFNVKGKLESILVDTARDIILVAQEDKNIISIFTLSGKPTNLAIGGFIADPEGIAKYKDLYILTDQKKDITRFYVFRGINYLSYFEQDGVANTDGINVYGDFLFAVDDDQYLCKINLPFVLSESSSHFPSSIQY